MHISIHMRIFIVVIISAVVITASGLAAGAWFLTRSITRTIEDHMIVAADIADHYVTTEITLLKAKAADTARDIDLMYRNGEREGVLERVGESYPIYIGMAVFNEMSMLDSWGVSAVPRDLFRERFMQTAIAGGQAISTTMRSSDGMLVMYVSTPISRGLVLAAVLDGMYFNNLMSQVSFWQSGHLFIYDKEGTVITNIRRHWVQDRFNFFETADADSSYTDLAKMIGRGVNGERGIGRYSIDGVPRICAFRPVSSSNGEWFMGLVAPLPESALKDIPAGILLMGLIMMALSIMAAILAAALLKHPFEEVDRLRRDAEIASVSKSTFLANMSHEIRTPMNSILGFSELALDTEVTPKTRDYLGKIKTNAEWLLQIINDILDISKVESGKIDLENIPFDLHELFSSCRTLIMPKAVEKGITLYFYAEPSLGKKLLGDPTRLRQVLVNLLSNAVKFTNTGMVKLNANLREMRDNKATMYFEVKDSGIGLTAEQIKKIFEPFMQAEAGTTRKYGGTGLGLSITKNIVEMMGGKLSVESTPGIGSKFSFVLTFGTENELDDYLLEKNIPLSELEKPCFSGEVLLCEDNAMNQQVICEHLTRVGLETVVAGNGKLGLELVKSRMLKGQKQFDLIFMDVHMPVMDGLEASTRIFALNAGVPIVAMTANVMSNDREIYQNSGMSDCLGKPFTSQELWRCLLKYFTPVIGGSGQEKSEKIEADMKFQKELQLLFLRSNREKYGEIVKALEKGDIKQAFRLAHSLKGNAGQIGKILLQQAAADVEHQLKGGENLVTDIQLKHLENELTMVLNELNLMYDETPVQTESTHVLEPAKVKELAARLEPLLAGGNPECLSLIEDLRGVPGSGHLIQQMEDFDFDSALSTFIELKKGWA